MIDQTFRWSDHFRGLTNGIFHVLLLGIGWCIYLLPWSLFIYMCCRSPRRQHYRTHWVLAPAVVVLLIFIGGLLFDPPTPFRRFKSFAKTELPKDVHDLYFSFSGGGLADRSDTYYFLTTPEEVGRLIREMDLSLDEGYGHGCCSYTSITRLPDCPDFSSWSDTKLYQNYDQENGRFYYLLTDAFRTRVYMMFCSI